MTTEPKTPDAALFASTLALHAAERPTVHVSDTPAETYGPMIAAAITGSIVATGRCRLGLSGGSTPGPIFAWLRTHLPASIYPQLLVTWVDERHLPVVDGAPGHWQAFDAQSNLRGAYEAWLAHVPIAPERVLPMSLGGDVGREVVRFGRAFVDQFDGALDVAILGCGADGHIASLFPGHPALEVDDICLAVHDSPKPPAVRISLALPVLNRSGATFVLANGAEKADMLAMAYNGDVTLPLARLRPQAPAQWLLDRSAAHHIVHGWL
jgi:6-phosphogluconolactonase